jgi:hypothetical protein
MDTVSTRRKAGTTDTGPRVAEPSVVRVHTRAARSNPQPRRTVAESPEDTLRYQGPEAPTTQVALCPALGAPPGLVDRATMAADLGQTARRAAAIAATGFALPGGAASRRPPAADMRSPGEPREAGRPKAVGIGKRTVAAEGAAYRAEPGLAEAPGMGRAAAMGNRASPAGSADSTNWRPTAAAVRRHRRSWPRHSGGTPSRRVPRPTVVATEPRAGPVECGEPSKSTSPRHGR